MKRTICILLIALMGLDMLAGCQKTLETPLVVGKNNEIMLEKAQADEPMPSDTDTVAVDLYDRLNAPQNYTADLVSKGGKLTVHVDANVELPDSELPVFRIKLAEFSTEQVRTMASALLGNDPKYVMGLDTRTKAVCEREIQRLRDGIADWGNVGTDLFDMVYDTQDEAQKALDKLLAEVADAPESLPAITPDYSWQKPYVWSDAKGEIDTTDAYMTLWTMPDNATYSWIHAMNSREFSGNATFEYCRDFLYTTTGELGTNSADVSGMLPFSEQEAYSLASQTIQNMGLEGFVCSARYGVLNLNDPAGYSKTPLYTFFFTRQYAGIAETYTNDGQTGGAKDTTSWYYEMVQVRIDKDGIAYVKYSSPTEIVEPVMTATTLLPFDDIRGIFEKMVLIVGNRVDAGISMALESQEYVITDVRLGLMSVREENADTGLMIPVWDFLGYENYVLTNGENGTTGSNRLTSYLTINAIDGSIVQRGYGY